MTSDRTQSSSPSELRLRAEAQVGEREAQSPEPLTVEAARQLLHELQVHQIELQLQNEELQRAQAELEIARNRYFDLYDLAPVGYLTLDGQGIITEANLRAAELLGVTRKALVQAPLSRFVLPEGQDTYYLHLRQLTLGRTPQACELQLQRADAAPFWGRLESTATAAPETSVAYSVLLSDISERRHLQQELIRAERLRAVGELAAGVCHNLNNMLTAIALPAEMILLHSGDVAKVTHLAELVRGAAQRAAGLVHQLHVSVRSRDTEPLQATDLDQTVAEVVELLQPRWKDEPEGQGLNIAVHLELEETPPISGTPTGLHDMVANLILNAVDAMPRGGTITLRSNTQGAFVQLHCIDTGIGMDEETRLRVFEPFFTTKARVGTGLGLSTLHNTLEHWGGTATVASTPGKGSAFVLSFPVWKEPHPSALPQDEAASSRPGRILIVDDSEAVGRAVLAALSVRHQGKVFTGGAEALGDFGPGRYDVAILDLGMPDLAGDQVASRMRTLDPAIGLILCSGWELPLSDPRRQVFDFALTKPFRSVTAFNDIVARAIRLCDQRRGQALG